MYAHATAPTQEQRPVRQSKEEASMNTIVTAAAVDPSLDYHLKTGHTLSVQNRPTGLAEDVIVLPCCSVRLQGLGLSPRSAV